MINKYVMMVVAVVFCMLSFTSCDKDKEIDNPIVGTWYNVDDDDGFATFFADGTVYWWGIYDTYGLEIGGKGTYIYSSSSGTLVLKMVETGYDDYETTTLEVLNIDNSMMRLRNKKGEFILVKTKTPYSQSELEKAFQKQVAKYKK